MKSSRLPFSGPFTLISLAVSLPLFASVALAQAPSHMWSKAFGSATNDQGNAVAKDASGNVYLTGSYTGTVNFGGQNFTCGPTSDGCVFLAKFAADGTPIWSKNFSNDYGSGKA